MNLRQILIVGITGAATMPAAMSASTVYRTISKVAAVAVDCPQGTVPRLPNLVWVTSVSYTHLTLPTICSV